MSPVKSQVERDNMDVFASTLMLEEYVGLSGTGAAERSVLFPIEERIVRQYFSPPPARVLDLGCGAG